MNCISITRWLICCCLLLVLAACGNKGPLVPPEDNDEKTERKVY